MIAKLSRFKLKVLGYVVKLSSKNIFIIFQFLRFYLPNVMPYIAKEKRVNIGVIKKSLLKSKILTLMHSMCATSAVLNDIWSIDICMERFNLVSNLLSNIVHKILKISIQSNYISFWVYLFCQRVCNMRKEVWEIL